MPDAVRLPRTPDEGAGNRRAQVPRGPLRLREAGAGGEAHQLHHPAHRVSRGGRQNVIHLTLREEQACGLHHTGSEVRIRASFDPDDSPDARRAIRTTQRRHVGVARRGGGGRRTRKARRYHDCAEAAGGPRRARAASRRRRGRRRTRRGRHGVQHDDEGARGGRAGLRLPGLPRAGGGRHSPKRLVDRVPLVLAVSRNGAVDIAITHPRWNQFHDLTSAQISLQVISIPRFVKPHGTAQSQAPACN